VDGEIRRPDHPVGALEVGADLLPPPDVVAEREDVGARGQQAVRQARRQAGAVGRVLAVDDAEADLELVLEAGEALLDGRPARRPEDVRDEEDLQGIESAAAGCTSIDTWLPASCVTCASA
jgi:hypothetical protein